MRSATLMPQLSPYLTLHVLRIQPTWFAFMRDQLKLFRIIEKPIAADYTWRRNRLRHGTRSSVLATRA